jgi:hypothetical protein
LTIATDTFAILAGAALALFALSLIAGAAWDKHHQPSDRDKAEAAADDAARRSKQNGS